MWAKLARRDLAEFGTRLAFRSRCERCRSTRVGHSLRRSGRPAGTTRRRRRWFPPDLRNTSCHNPRRHSRTRDRKSPGRPPEPPHRFRLQRSRRLSCCRTPSRRSPDSRCTGHLRLQVRTSTEHSMSRLKHREKTVVALAPPMATWSPRVRSTEKSIKDNDTHFQTQKQPPCKRVSGAVGISLPFGHRLAKVNAVGGYAIT